MGRFGKHKWWIVTALLTAPLVAVAAGVPHMFTANTVISSAQVNANFTNLADRVTALESARKTKVTVAMNNLAGPLGTTGKMASFTTTGGALLIIVSATSYSATDYALSLAVQLDGTNIGNLTAFTNEISSHKALPTRAFSVAAPAAGSHTIGILNGNAATINDTNDFFSVTVVEIAN
jgi:hypothetical protein